TRSGQRRAEHERTIAVSPPLSSRRPAPRLAEDSTADERRCGRDESAAAANGEVHGIAVLELGARDRVQGAPVFEFAAKEGGPFAPMDYFDRACRDSEKRFGVALGREAVRRAARAAACCATTHDTRLNRHRKKRSRPPELHVRRFCGPKKTGLQKFNGVSG